ncbi:hypothetical protein YYC_01771 [Plasmodium yoelii 17X]|uniref:Uncharacterized protein n=3 Tax=Plasmodium yoelii TaxID=5861 RepID=A0AAF0B3I3_PLAYO|nr:conserved protein, unknown function [Plasmodium yoelii]ETB62026.1 hypothetical protein YYC_01771 [Plasmodium yoelii 17X]WBY61272.1 hypothetical protein Py17XNL_001401450 [Plasmodium yoelii yoelii]CDU20970.1 conserved Plasmodium protein, unknown function [Plasmodium yoelii]VTZ81936.1 conserved protein, unknown function [Plasmodium yoelii]|eukprot:XP_022813058.1 conserved protein, unknown function [Plasmodium yoelii]
MENKTVDHNFHLIKDLKPFLNNISLQCLILKYIDDPPDHINNIIKYHYHVADKSGSVILCIPQNFIQEELEKYNIDILNDDIDDSVELHENREFDTFENTNTLNDKIQYNHNINKKPNNLKIMKYFFRVGDILKITGAVTTWSMGKMVIMPNTRSKKNNSQEIRGSIERLGFFVMNINEEPNISNIIISTTEKKYQDNRQSNYIIRNNVINKTLYNFKKNKSSKYDIFPLFNNDNML